MACTVEEMKLYETWLNSAKDADILAELKDVEGKDEEISDRFYRYLEFGTGGLRGVIGAGTNRMNIYTVSMAAQARSPITSRRRAAPMPSPSATIPATSPPTSQSVRPLRLPPTG